MEALNFQIDINTQITNIVSSIGNHDQMSESDYQSLPLYKNICKLTSALEPLVFILPAFPAKSASPEKTSGAHADLGEVLALNNLNKICIEINKIYSPGAKVVICSDGRVFNDLVMVSDENLQKYKYDLFRICEEFNLKNIFFFDLDDCYQGSFITMRLSLVEDYGKTVEDIRNEVKCDLSTQSMFNGLHRFLKDDISVLKNDLSKNQQNKLSKDLAYKVILRSRSWDHMLAKKFPNTLRLSIHPYPITHPKFGVKLVASSDKWGTPWHNVTVKHNGSFQLMKKKDAIALGAKKQLYKEYYAYYQL